MSCSEALDVFIVFRQFRHKEVTLKVYYTLKDIVFSVEIKHLREVFLIKRYTKELKIQKSL